MKMRCRESNFSFLDRMRYLSIEKAQFEFKTTQNMICETAIKPGCELKFRRKLESSFKWLKRKLECIRCHL